MQIKEKVKGDLGIKLTSLLLDAEFHNTGAINTNSQVTQHQRLCDVKQGFLGCFLMAQACLHPNKERKQLSVLSA